MLTVLCILTFLNAGYNVISNAIALAVTDPVEQRDEAMEAIESASESMEQSDVPSWLEGFMASSGDMASEALEHFTLLTTGEILFYLISLVGAFLMWRLDKRGFMIYAVANVLLALFPLAVYTLNGMVLLSVLVPFLFTVLFIGLYWSKTKEMS